MLNQQPPLTKNLDMTTVAIHSIWPTLQGEGPFVGTPALFVRLIGCNLQCPNCDTLYMPASKTDDSFRSIMGVEEAAEAILERLDGFCQGRGNSIHPLIVITGGEPLRQMGTLSLVDILLKKSPCSVQIETNGTIALPPHRQSCRRVTFVVSPKNGAVDLSWGREQSARDSGKHNVHWKYVGKAGGLDPVDGLPTSVLGYSARPTRPPYFVESSGKVYLQPEDSKDVAENKRNEEAVVASCMKFGYRLTPQLHKILGLP